MKSNLNHFLRPGLLGLILISICCFHASTLNAQAVKWYWSEDAATSKSIEQVDEFLRSTAPPGPSNQPLKYAFNGWGIPFIFDDKALEEEGISSDTPVSVNLDDVTMHTMLRLILEPLNLTYVPEPNFIRITNRKQSGNRVCVYDVGHLIRHSSQPSNKGQSLRQGNFNEIMRLIETSIEPEVWTSAGGTATMIPYRGNGKLLLVVNADTEAHHGIQGLFRTLDRTEGIEAPRKQTNATYESRSSLSRSKLSRTKH